MQEDATTQEDEKGKGFINLYIQVIACCCLSRTSRYSGDSCYIANQILQNLQNEVYQALIATRRENNALVRAGIGHFVSYFPASPVESFTHC